MPCLDKSLQEERRKHLCDNLYTVTGNKKGKTGATCFFYTVLPVKLQQDVKKSFTHFWRTPAAPWLVDELLAGFLWEFCIVFHFSLCLSKHLALALTALPGEVNKIHFNKTLTHKWRTPQRSPCTHKCLLTKRTIYHSFALLSIFNSCLFVWSSVCMWRH